MCVCAIMLKIAMLEAPAYSTQHFAHVLTVDRQVQCTSVSLVDGRVHGDRVAIHVSEEGCVEWAEPLVASPAWDGAVLETGWLLGCALTRGNALVLVVAPYVAGDAGDVEAAAAEAQAGWDDDALGPPTVWVARQDDDSTAREVAMHVVPLVGAASSTLLGTLAVPLNGMVAAPDAAVAVVDGEDVVHVVRPGESMAHSFHGGGSVTAAWLDGDTHVWLGFSTGDVARVEARPPHTVVDRFWTGMSSVRSMARSRAGTLYVVGSGDHLYVAAFREDAPSVWRAVDDPQPLETLDVVAVPVSCATVQCAPFDTCADGVAVLATSPGVWCGVVGVEL